MDCVVTYAIEENFTRAARLFTFTTPGTLNARPGVTVYEIMGEPLKGSIYTGTFTNGNSA
jgi:hypothetical protein